MKLNLQALTISDVKLVSASRISDSRGYFADMCVTILLRQGSITTSSRTMILGPIRPEPFVACIFRCLR